jgi:hypothetical protein
LSNGKSEMERWFVRTEEVLGCVIEKRLLGMDFVEKLVDALTRTDNKLNDTEMALEGKNAFQALFTANAQQEYQKAGLLYMAGNLGVKDEKLITQAQQDLTVALTKANFDLLKLFIPNSSELQSSLKSIFGDLIPESLHNTAAVVNKLSEQSEKPDALRTWYCKQLLHSEQIKTFINYLLAECKVDK